MFYEEMAAERLRRLRDEGAEARRVHGLVSVRRAERKARRARSRLRTARLRLARLA
jgi:hypothetical protein